MLTSREPSRCGGSHRRRINWRLRGRQRSSDNGRGGDNNASYPSCQLGTSHCYALLTSQRQETAIGNATTGSFFNHGDAGIGSQGSTLSFSERLRHFQETNITVNCEFCISIALEYNHLLFEIRRLCEVLDTMLMG